MLHGYDVSAYQSNSVPDADFIFVKATEGSGYTSSRFAAQWADAKRKGMIRGAYHFARPEQSSAIHQADRLLSTARAVPGELLCLDLEASDLGQAATNAWAKLFGDRLRAKAPGVTTVAYLGSGYATNGTGRDLSKHFDLWWYPQYPSTRSTTAWPSRFSPWLPGGITTGWERPHIWQFTDNFAGYDASISTLTTTQLAHGGRTPLAEDDMVSGNFNLKRGETFTIPWDHGKIKGIAFFCDNSFADAENGIVAEPPQALRVAILDTAGKVIETLHIKVGRGPDDTVTKQYNHLLKNAASANVAYVTREDDGTKNVGFCAY